MNTIERIKNCQICNGAGISTWWVAPDGDYDFEWCECNPELLLLDGDEVL